MFWHNGHQLANIQNLMSKHRRKNHFFFYDVKRINEEPIVTFQILLVYYRVDLTELLVYFSLNLDRS